MIIDTMRHIMIIAALAVFCLCGCRKGLEPEAEEIEVSFEISSAPDIAVDTKSSIDMSLFGIDVLDILIYHRGKLCKKLCISQTDMINYVYFPKARLIVGETYDILVLANHGGITYPATLTEALNTLIYRTQGFAKLEEYGVPMSGRATIVVSPLTSTVNIPLQRLCAILFLEADVSGLKHGRLEFTSVQVRQMNTVCPFFSDGVATSVSDVSDGDTGGEGAVACLNAGWQPYFFILENRQGTLIPNNINPDLKNPSILTVLGRNPGLCTYVEVGAVYTGSSEQMIGEPVTARFYLGEDACTNFNVNRNWRYTVYMKFTDDICFRTDWKMNCSLADNRSLAFATPYTELLPGDWNNINLTTNQRYDMGDYTYSLSGDTAAFETEFMGARGTFRVSAKANAAVGSAMKITVTTWDKALTASHMVYVR